MKSEYDIAKLNPRSNPYAKRLKKAVTINLDVPTIDYFKQEVVRTGLPYQINRFRFPSVP
ncbi:MAG: hypothetical protein IJK56_03440 [Firmicutes bacterium]|nr:hypothetical protein [Bacillota bacterium]